MGELRDHGCLSTPYLKTCIEDHDGKELHESMTVYPVHAVWPMGFSWSSAIGQSCSVSCCIKAGVSEESIVALDHEAPADQSEVAFVATDDILLIHRCRSRAKATLDKLGAVMIDHGMPGNVDKNVDMESSIVGLGCELSSSPALCEPARDKLRKLACGYLDLLLHPVGSPRAVNAALGLSQWFCLMQRGLFSIYDSVYAFVRQLPSDTPAVLPQGSLDEILVSLILLPMLSASLDRQWLPELVATDASSGYGFGVVAAPYSARKVAQIGRLAEKRGDYVRLTATEDSEAWRDRIGEPHQIDLTAADFRTVVMKSARWKTHISSLEGHALLLGLRHLARAGCKHGTKAVLLVDSKCMLGAAAKGRSSARGLRGICRSFGATCIAANILPRLVYIPSESNPSDAPSRGKRPLPGKRSVCKHFSSKSRFPWTKFENHMARLARCQFS